MKTRIFDVVLIGLAGLFVQEALRTPPESYDVMGPALWPFGVAGVVLALLVANVLRPQKVISAHEPLTFRLGLFVAFAICFVAVQFLDIIPFFVSATAFLFASYLVMSHAPRPLESLCAAFSILAFSFGVQTLFTTVIHLDLPTGS